MNEKINFITYGDSNYFIQRHHLKSVTKKSGFFSSVKAFSYKNLDKGFRKEFENILKHSKGGGFWIWKHYFIMQELELMKNNDILVWSDAGSSFNYFAKNKFSQYIEILNSSNENNLRFRMKYIENEWTTKELFQYFNLDPYSEIGKSGQFHATHMIFKKNDLLTEYMKKYKKLLTDNPLLITDYYVKNQIPEFKENRHDQSIFSLLSKTLGCVEIPRDEACSSEILNDQHNYPFLSTRTKYSTSKKIKFILGYFYYRNKPIYFNDKRFWFQRPSIYERILYKLNKMKLKD